jgi:hypothetical protein
VAWVAWVSIPPFFERREFAVSWNPSDSNAQGTVDARQKKDPPSPSMPSMPSIDRTALGSRRAQREKTPLCKPWMTAYFEDFPLRAGPRVVV